MSAPLNTGLLVKELIQSAHNIADQFGPEAYKHTPQFRAATHIQTLEAALRGLLRGEYESADPGLCDCVDNDGKPYQSKYLADRIALAEACLAEADGTKPS